MSQHDMIKNVKRAKILSRRARYLKSFLKAPGLLSSENAREHDAVCRAVQSELPAETFIEKWRAAQVANAIWNAQRIQRMEAGIIESARIDALVDILRKFGRDSDKKRQTAVHYFEGSDDDKRRARRTVEKLGITPDMIEAYALELKLPTILTFEKMKMHNEQIIEKLEKKRKKLARVKKGKEKSKDSNGRSNNERANIKLVSARSRDSWDDDQG